MTAGILFLLVIIAVMIMLGMSGTHRQDKPDTQGQEAPSGQNQRMRAVAEQISEAQAAQEDLFRIKDCSASARRRLLDLGWQAVQEEAARSYHAEK